MSRDDWRALGRLGLAMAGWAALSAVVMVAVGGAAVLIGLALTAVL